MSSLCFVVKLSDQIDAVFKTEEGAEEYLRGLGYENSDICPHLFTKIHPNSPHVELESSIEVAEYYTP